MKKLLFLVLFAPALLNGAANNDDNNNNNNLVQQFQNMHINNNNHIQQWIIAAQNSYDKIQNRPDLASRRHGFRAFALSAEGYFNSHFNQLNDAQRNVIENLILNARQQAVQRQQVVRNLALDFASDEDQDN